MNKRLTWKRLILWILLAGVLVLAAAVAVWSAQTLAPADSALQALQSDDQVRVTRAQGLIIFEPHGAVPDTGFVLYPGAGVDYRAYAPALRQLAAQGRVVVLLEMPLNLAFFGADRAAEAIAQRPEVSDWVVGGHSLGGVVAAQYAARRRAVSGLALWASYPANDALRTADLPVLSLYGSRDGLTTPADIEGARDLLPPDTLYVAIEGGNHAQFGAYGAQNGDNEAAISPEEQWAQIVVAMETFLRTVSP